MDKLEDFHEWAVVELLGKEGETYDDVIRRISKERSPSASASHTWSGVLYTPVVESYPVEPPKNPPRYVWKDPLTKNKKRRPRSNVSRETSRSSSVVKARVREVPVQKEWTWNNGQPIVVDREMVKNLTVRQSELAMKILANLEKE